jgi:hypothetical protein
MTVGRGVMQPSNTTAGGSAAASGRVSARGDGPCLVGTLENLRVGHGAKPMPEAALEKIRSDAIALLEEVLVAYESNVAAGEVGANGSGLASQAPPVGGKCPTGLLYGRIQSGKTVAMITFAAAALDNGFRVVVVLTSDFLKLIEQTAERFGALAGPLIRSSLRSDEWSVDAEHVAKHIAEHGVVFVCAKNNQHLGRLVAFLDEIGASGYPALVLDDEADQATLDTTTAARAAGKPNAPKKGSAIHRRTVQNDDPTEEGQSVRERLRHHMFVQVTATPYALLLQNVQNVLRPRFARLLEPGGGYTGGEAFFDVGHVDGPSPPLVYVEAHESAEIENGAEEAPLGLRQALAFFLVAAGAQNMVSPQTRSAGQNFLCHTSHKTVEHERVAGLIRAYVSQVGDDLRRPGLPGETGMRLQGAYDELRRTMPDAPGLPEILTEVRRRLPRRTVPVVNSANSPAEFGRELNFIVGGNILGRGLTIENLLVTYYLRRAKVSQMDTVLQHARMYGYRSSLMHLTRVFLPEDLAVRFHHIHTAEQSLRQQLHAAGPSTPVAVATLSDLRATRLNVLDTGSLCAYEPGQQVFPAQPAFGERANVSVRRKLESVIGEPLRASEFRPLPITSLVELLSVLPFDPDNANTWMPDVLAKLLTALAPRYGGRGHFHYREMKRKSKTGHFATGAASGAEVAEAKGLGGPVLFAFLDHGQLMDPSVTKGHPFWYPTLVLPADMPNHVFNYT